MKYAPTFLALALLGGCAQMSAAPRTPQTPKEMAAFQCYDTARAEGGGFESCMASKGFSDSATTRHGDAEDARTGATAGPNEITLIRHGDALYVPVTINTSIQLNFLIDSGASDVTIPADVVLTLMRLGTIASDDFLGRRTYQLADGSTVPSTIFRIKSLKVGDITLQNVVGSVASVQGGLLLGQSFLSHFRSWSIDNNRRILTLE